MNLFCNTFETKHVHIDEEHPACKSTAGATAILSLLLESVLTWSNFRKVGLLNRSQMWQLFLYAYVIVSVLVSRKRV